MIERRKGGKTAEGQGRASHCRQRGGDGRHARGSSWRKIDGASSQWERASRDECRCAAGSRVAEVLIPLVPLP